MSFVLEVSKNGRDTMLLKNYRYRELYTVKRGELCGVLGINLYGRVRINYEHTVIYTSNETHGGTHPVTLRTLPHTPPQKRPPPAATSVPAASSPALQPQLTSIVSASLPKENSDLKE